MPYEIEEQYEFYLKKCEHLDKYGKTITDFHYRGIAPERMIIKLNDFIPYFEKQKNWKRLNRSRAILQELTLKLAVKGRTTVKTTVKN